VSSEILQSIRRLTCRCIILVLLSKLFANYTLKVFKMSDNISLDEIKRKIRDGQFKTFQRDASKTEIWKFFLAIRKTGCTVTERRTAPSPDTVDSILFVHSNKK